MDPIRNTNVSLITYNNNLQKGRLTGNHTMHTDTQDIRNHTKVETHYQATNHSDTTNLVSYR